MNECSVASSVRSLDFDVSLDHLNANVGCRCRCYGSGNARAHQEGCKVAPCDVSGMRLVARLAFLVVCHSFSCKEFSAFRWQTAPSDHQSPWGVSFLGISCKGLVPVLQFVILSGAGTSRSEAPAESKSLS